MKGDKYNYCEATARAIAAGIRSGQITNRTRGGFGKTVFDHAASMNIPGKKNTRQDPERGGKTGGGDAASRSVRGMARTVTERRTAYH